MRTSCFLAVEISGCQTPLAVRTSCSLAVVEISGCQKSLAARPCRSPVEISRFKTQLATCTLCKLICADQQFPTVTGQRWPIAHRASEPIHCRHQSLRWLGRTTRCNGTFTLPSQYHDLGARGESTLPRVCYYVSPAVGGCEGV